MKIVIKNGRFIDPASKTDDFFDILIEDDTIKEISKNIKINDEDVVVDASDCLVLPGLIDMHVHFREPGREDIESIIGGSKVAAKSGFTSVCTMPNTNPVIDNQSLVRFIKLEAEKGRINVFPVATATASIPLKIPLLCVVALYTSISAILTACWNFFANSSPVNLLSTSSKSL